MTLRCYEKNILLYWYQPQIEWILEKKEFPHNFIYFKRELDSCQYSFDKIVEMICLAMSLDANCIHPTYQDAKIAFKMIYSNQIPIVHAIYVHYKILVHIFSIKYFDQFNVIWNCQ